MYEGMHEITSPRTIYIERICHIVEYLIFINKKWSEFRLNFSLSFFDILLGCLLISLYTFMWFFIRMIRKYFYIRFFKVYHLFNRLLRHLVYCHTLHPANLLGIHLLTAVTWRPCISNTQSEREKKICLWAKWHRSKSIKTSCIVLKLKLAILL